MFRNYLTAALRNLLRNKLFAGLNIVGLSAGFAAALLIGLYVRDELSYDRWIPGFERIYRVDAGNVGRFSSNTGPSDVGIWLTQEVPQAEAVTRLFMMTSTLGRGEVEHSEIVAWADPSTFDVFRLPVVAGDLGHALDEPDTIVINRAMARKYFGRDDPVGEILTVDRVNPMRVTAVIADFPSNTHLNVQIFASSRAPFSTAALQDRTPIGQFGQKLWNSATYFRLAPGASLASIQNMFPAMLDRHSPPNVLGVKASDAYTLTARAITDIHLLAKKPGESVRDMDFLYALAAVGLLVVLVAVINFINLMTARGAQRAIEIGVRKSTGAGQSNLVHQFVGESLIYVAFALAVAFALVAAVLPAFNAFLLRTITFEIWRRPADAAFVVAGVAIVGVLAGIYPALVLARFRPASVLKGSVAGTESSGHVRHVLVIVQFAVLIGLGLATAVFYLQTTFAVRETLRQGGDQMLLVYNTKCAPALQSEMRALPGVLGATCSWYVPQTGGGPGTGFHYGETNVGVVYAAVDIGYLELYGLKPVAGRFFSADYGTDLVPPTDEWTRPEAVVINETAARQLGFDTPQDAVGRVMVWNHLRAFPATFTGRHDAQVIGVVEDFPIGSVREEVRPFVFYADPNLANVLSIKLAGKGIPDTLAAIEGVWNRVGEPHPMVREFMDFNVQRLYLDISRRTALFAGFSVVAILISLLGLFGLSVFTAARRTKEIGIRKAMGAEAGDVLRLLVWQFMKPVLWANLIAWPVAYVVLHRWLEGFAYHVDLEPWIFLAVSSAALAIAVLTVSGHVWLVARTQPVHALRYE